MIYRILAEALMAFHFAFVAFVIAGGLVVLWRRWAVWLHLPAVAWGIFIELSHGMCPLTPAENSLRELGGQAGYAGGFIEHYVRPILYPRGLTDQMQVAIACLIIGANLACYGVMLRRGYRTRAARRLGPSAVAPVDVKSDGAPAVSPRTSRDPAAA